MEWNQVICWRFTLGQWKFAHRPSVGPTCWFYVGPKCFSTAAIQNVCSPYVSCISKSIDLKTKNWNESCLNLIALKVSVMFHPYFSVLLLKSHWFFKPHILPTYISFEILVAPDGLPELFLSYPFFLSSLFPIPSLSFDLPQYTPSTIHSFSLRLLILY